jgi:hypothetical protein
MYNSSKETNKPTSEAAAIFAQATCQPQAAIPTATTQQMGIARLAGHRRPTNSTPTATIGIIAKIAWTVGVICFILYLGLIAAKRIYPTNRLL